VVVDVIDEIGPDEPAAARYENGMRLFFLHESSGLAGWQARNEPELEGNQMKMQGKRSIDSRTRTGSEQWRNSTKI